MYLCMYEVFLLGKWNIFQKRNGTFTTLFYICGSMDIRHNNVKPRITQIHFFPRGSIQTFLRGVRKLPPKMQFWGFPCILFNRTNYNFVL